MFYSYMKRKSCYWNHLIEIISLHILILMQFLMKEYFFLNLINTIGFCCRFKFRVYDSLCFVFFFVEFVTNCIYSKR